MHALSPTCLPQVYKVIYASGYINYALLVIFAAPLSVNVQSRCLDRDSEQPSASESMVMVQHSRGMQVCKIGGRTRVSQALGTCTSLLAGQAHTILLRAIAMKTAPPHAFTPALATVRRCSLLQRVKHGSMTDSAQRLCSAGYVFASQKCLGQNCRGMTGLEFEQCFLLLVISVYNRNMLCQSGQALNGVMSADM